MPRVFRLDIGDSRMAGIAKQLLTAHLVVLGIALLYGVLECVEHFTVKGALADLEESTGESQEMALANGGMIVILNVAFPLFCPLVIFLVLWYGVRNNNESVLQGICFLDGFCVCCTGCATVSGILSFIWMNAMQRWAKDYECHEDGWSNGEMQVGPASREYSKAHCEATKDSVADAFGIIAVMAILGAVLSCCELFACIWGTVKSNEASLALKEHQVFCGPLRVPQGMGLPGQPGTVMVVGQPVGMGNVAVGQPVSAAAAAAQPAIAAQPVQAKTVQS